MLLLSTDIWMSGMILLYYLHCPLSSPKKCFNDELTDTRHTCRWNADFIFCLWDLGGDYVFSWYFGQTSWVTVDCLISHMKQNWFEIKYKETLQIAVIMIMMIRMRKILIEIICLKKTIILRKVHAKCTLIKGFFLVLSITTYFSKR